ncbi:hypothetical protein ACQYAD_04635 [Neobacillus sp. SM06]|uniref:hypothetical protein n=1 Tax=Neobacillus sp. SM06 TaxID=3422492 RepID=UPI003D2AF7E6
MAYLFKKIKKVRTRTDRLTADFKRLSKNFKGISGNFKGITSRIQGIKANSKEIPAIFKGRARNKRSRSPIAE